MTIRKHAMLRALPEATEEAPLPTAFLIFAPGVNDSFNGPCLYDQEAAKQVAAAYQKHGIRLIVDLEHDSLNWCDRSDAHDARAWFDLDFREDGSLWATNVEWTPDGARRLRERTQRYTSPAFTVDLIKYTTADGIEIDMPRVTCLLNVALCSMPATYGNAALVRGARAPKTRPRIRATVRNMLTPELASAAAEAIKNQDGDAALQLLTDIMVSAASGEAEATPSAEPAPEASAELEANATDEAPADDPKDEEDKPETNTVATPAVDPDAVERNALVARLVACGAETPATAWSVRGKIPVKRLADEPIAELRARVPNHEAARKAPPKAPTSAPADPVKKLSASDLAACKRAGITPEEFIARKAGALRRAKGAK